MVDEPKRGVSFRYVVYRGRRVSLVAAAQASGVKYQTLWKRLNQGWPLAKALCPPSQ
jgi:hypothetical protein